MNGIYGIGTDLVEVHRLRESMERHGERFRDRIFTPSEIAYCESHSGEAKFRCFAARFAAKEAVAKAFRVGIGPAFDWVDLEIVRDADTGAPSVQLHGRAPGFARQEQTGTIHLSLSHAETHAIAYAVIERA